MKKHVGLLLIILPLLAPAFCQDKYIQQPTLGINVSFNDFRPVKSIRAPSLANMSSGLALNYMNGLNAHVDFATTITGTVIDYPKPNGTLLAQESLLLEGDVSIKAKLFTNRYWVSPFVQVGTGISKYSVYWGAFIPAGIGVQINLFNEAFFIFQAQYRIAVTNTVSDHVFYSLGIAGVIGRRRSENLSVLPED